MASCGSSEDGCSQYVLVRPNDRLSSSSPERSSMAKSGTAAMMGEPKVWVKLDGVQFFRGVQ